MKTAKVFSNGRSLAVRIPRKWLGSADEVEMEKHNDTIILRPKRKSLLEIAEAFRKEPLIIERLPQSHTPPRDI